MKPSLALGLLCALFSEVAALTCYECYNEDCTPARKVTCPDVCASMTSNIYAGEEVEGTHVKRCLPEDKCITASRNFGFLEETLSTECCKTDFCNSQNAPELNDNTPNGKKCYTCIADDCTNQLSCVGNEDHCIEGTMAVDGLNFTAKGCASSTVCLGSALQYDELRIECCKGDLCNSAKSVGQSFLLLLGSLVSVLLFQ